MGVGRDKFVDVGGEGGGGEVRIEEEDLVVGRGEEGGGILRRKQDKAPGQKKRAVQRGTKQQNRSRMQSSCSFGVVKWGKV